MSYRLQYASATERAEIEKFQKRMFIGQEVEYNNNYGLKTLFVVGLRDANIILFQARELDCKHIFFGANYSNPGHFDSEWSKMINQVCLHLPATIDVSQESIESFVKCKLHLIENLSVQIRLTVPHIKQLLNDRTFVKLDDLQQRTNNDVRVIKLRSIYDNSKATEWKEYGNDQYCE